jgi:hypothetical protein
MKPTVIKNTIFLLIIFYFLDFIPFLLSEWQTETWGWRVAAVCFYILLFVGLWFFWLGRKWALDLVWCLAFLDIVYFITKTLPEYHFGETTISQLILKIISFLLSIFLLFWLRTSRVRDHFQKGRR